MAVSREYDTQNSVTTDGLCKGFSNSQESIEEFYIREHKIPVGPCDEEYKMDHDYRGKVIIFNHEIYRKSLKLPQRKGTHKDIENIKQSFEKLKFDIDLQDDLKLQDIRKKLQQESADDYHAECDCLVIIVLTHGKRSGKVYAYDKSYHVDELWSNFTAAKCPSLVGKPKLFIIQACRGSTPSKGIYTRIHSDAHPTKVCENHRPTYKIPEEADILVAFSTYEGRVSYRDEENGTWYIEELCKELDSNEKDDNIVSLLTKVNRAVAVEKEYVQMPIFQSTLTRKIFFGNSHKRIDLITNLSQTNHNAIVTEPNQEGSADFHWDSLRMNIVAPDVSLDNDDAVLMLGKSLQLFLDRKQQPEGIEKDGQTILCLLSYWKVLDWNCQRLVFNRLVEYLNKHAKDWNGYRTCFEPITQGYPAIVD